MARRGPDGHDGMQEVRVTANYGAAELRRLASTCCDARIVRRQAVGLKDGTYAVTSANRVTLGFGPMRHLVPIACSNAASTTPGFHRGCAVASTI